MIKLDDSAIFEFERKLVRFPRALQFAQKNTVNDLAFHTKEGGKMNIRNQMTLRNKWTEGSIQVDRARGLGDPAVVGSVRDYLATQEFGGTRSADGAKGVPIPTSYATGEGLSKKPRQKTAKPRNRLDRLKLGKRTPRASSRKQDMVIRVREAVRTRRREIYLDLGAKQGIFRVVGGSTKTKRGWPKGASLRMIYDLTHRTTPVPRNPWLEPATNDAVAQRWQIWGRRAGEQVERLRTRR